MISCTTCEHYRVENGSPRLLCNVLSTIKEPECLQKWQVIELQLNNRRLATVVGQQERIISELSILRQAGEATLANHQRLAPLQEQVIKHLQREMRDVDETERWKIDDDEDDDGSHDTR